MQNQKMIHCVYHRIQFCRNASLSVRLSNTLQIHSQMERCRNVRRLLLTLLIGEVIFDIKSHWERICRNCCISSWKVDRFTSNQL